MSARADGLHETAATGRLPMYRPLVVLLDSGAVSVSIEYASDAAAREAASRVRSAYKQQGVKGVVVSRTDRAVRIRREDAMSGFYRMSKADASRVIALLNRRNCGVRVEDADGKVVLRVTEGTMAGTRQTVITLREEEGE